MSLPEQGWVRKRLRLLKWELLLTSDFSTPLICFSQSEQKATWVWGMPIILALGLRQEDHPKLKANLSYTFNSYSVKTERRWLKKAVQGHSSVAEHKPCTQEAIQSPALGERTIGNPGSRTQGCSRKTKRVASMPQALMFRPPHCRKRWGTCPIFKWNLILFTGLHKTRLPSNSEIRLPLPLEYCD